jgi:hypothetical protein
VPAFGKQIVFFPKTQYDTCIMQCLKNDTTMRYFLLVCLLIFTFSFADLTASFATCGDGAVSAVWAVPQGEGNTFLYYAQKNKSKWKVPVQLPVEPGFHITPAIAVDRHGTIWIVWIEQKGEENILRYAVVRQGKTETGRVLATKPNEEQSYAPVILIDQEDKVWIAWSGVQEGQLADIYVSSWQGTSWAEPVRINPPNKTPDITPLLGLRDGKQLWVSWLGINQDMYVRFTAELQNGKWQQVKETQSVEGLKDVISQKAHIETFPEQAGTWLTGALFGGLDCEIQSINERFASFHNTGDVL